MKKIELLELSYIKIKEMLSYARTNYLDIKDIEIVTREFSIDEIFKLLKELDITYDKFNKLDYIEEEFGVEKAKEEYNNNREYYHSNDTEREIITFYEELDAYEDGSYYICFLKNFWEVNEAKQFLVNLYLNGTKKTIYELAKAMINDSGIVIITVNK